MATFTYDPSPGAGLSETPRVEAVKFGDGYEQRAGTGINLVAQIWDLTFANRTLAQADAIVAFFRARSSVTSGLEAFDWTPPFASTAIKVVCREWQTTAHDSKFASVGARFEQVFE